MCFLCLVCGGGLTNGHSTSPASFAAESSPGLSPNPSATTPSNVGAADYTTSTGAAASPVPTYNSDCPALNSTVYHVPGSTKSFLRLCGVDYSGSTGGATDLANAFTGSMAECMNSCASFNECTACSWGYLQGDQGGQHRCFMKKDLRKGHSARSDWCFALMMD